MADPSSSTVTCAPQPQWLLAAHKRLMSGSAVVLQSQLVQCHLYVYNLVHLRFLSDQALQKICAMACDRNWSQLGLGACHPCNEQQQLHSLSCTLWSS